MKKQIKMAQPKESLEFLSFLFDLADATKASLADGKINWVDAGNYINSLWKAPAAFSGLNLIRQELDNPSSRAQILAYAKERFDIADNDLEELIENLVESGLQFGEDLAAIANYEKPEADA